MSEDRPQSFKDLFSKQAGAYAQYRPSYPGELFSYLASLTQHHERAWDCATGNGQAALGIVPYFKEVIATDASVEQIENAFPHPKIKYSVGLAEKSDLSSNSIDLITVATGVHWFHFDKFYAEASRVLKPDGVIAVWVYNQSKDDDEVTRIVGKFFDDHVENYFAEEVKKWVWTNYETLPFPFKEIAAPDFNLKVEWNTDELMGYLSSWSATQKHIEKHGMSALHTLRESIQSAMDKCGRKIKRSWKIHLRVGRK
jgi:SAM-dependent methyltransferase